MTKDDLLNSMKDVKGTDLISIVSSEYDSNDDMYWGSDYETEIIDVEVNDGICVIRVDTGEFA